MAKFCGGTSFCQDAVDNLLKAMTAWTAHNYGEDGDIEGPNHRVSVKHGLLAALEIGSFLGMRAEMEKMLNDGGYTIPTEE